MMVVAPNSPIKTRAGQVVKLSRLIGFLYVQVPNTDSLVYKVKNTSTVHYINGFLRGLLMPCERLFVMKSSKIGGLE